ncbi:hypothetical protein [Streptomyces sp. NBC_00356]|uniref:hypothetical protein n=1 Tax=Streptomyces sp. NBC_00356 TaxID=2975724 RepID=UPI002E2724EE
MDANEDFARTAALLGALDLYERRYETDAAFVEVIAPALACRSRSGSCRPCRTTATTTPRRADR